MATRAEYAARPGRESLGKRLGAVGLAIRERDGHKCAYCGVHAKNAGRAMQFDHLTPQSRGGADHPRNLVLSCQPCNSARKNMSLRKWAARFGKTHADVRAQAARVLPAVRGREVAPRPWMEAQRSAQLQLRRLPRAERDEVLRHVTKLAAGNQQAMRTHLVAEMARRAAPPIPRVAGPPAPPRLAPGLAKAPLHVPAAARRVTRAFGSGRVLSGWAAWRARKRA